MALGAIMHLYGQVLHSSNVLLTEMCREYATPPVSSECVVGRIMLMKHN